MTSAGYWIKTKSGPKGPFTLEQMRSMWFAGKLHGGALFNRDGGPNWASLGLVADLLESKPHELVAPRGEFTSSPQAHSTQPVPVAVVHMDPRPADKHLLYESRKKSGWVAALLNLLIPGAGYMYCGRVILGIFVFLFAVILVIVTLGVATPLVMLICVVDGFLCAGRANRDLASKLIAGHRISH